MSSIITFYSFKGGVGRTMALANIAVLLAQRGQRVLAVDWDLEAPGLHRYFGDRTPPNANRSGLMQLLTQAYEGRSVGPSEVAAFTSRVDLVGSGSLDLLPAGSGDPDFVGKLGALNWDEFFGARGGGSFIEALREMWLARYDTVLVDSRTGYTDTGGICTIQLPDVLVAVFTANRQSVDGVREAIKRAQAGRQALEYDRMPLLVFPLPSRFDGRAEFEESQHWLDVFADEMAGYYAPWLPARTPIRRIVERTKVPHVPVYSFGEKLPVLTDSLTDPEGAAWVFDTVASVIDADFRSADRILLGHEQVETPEKLSAELDAAIGLLEDQVALLAQRRRRALIYTRMLSAAGGVLVAVLLASAAFLPITRSVLVSVTATLALAAATAAYVALRPRATQLRGQQIELEALHRELALTQSLPVETHRDLLAYYETIARRLRELEGAGTPYEIEGPQKVRDQPQ